jgi:ABC-type glucose/galactose transport system permease subunit
MHWQHIIWKGFNPTAALRIQICGLHDSGTCVIIFGVAALYLEYTGNTLIQNLENNYQILAHVTTI